MNRKLALIIGNSHYQDPNLAKLVAPSEDVNDLANVLRDLDIGGFDGVTTLIDETDSTIRLSIEDFFADKKPDDLLVLYFSGHGVRDEQGRLYLAAPNTRATRLRATAIATDFITSEMDRSRSKRQVLILDCCHSGAFAQGSKAVTGESAGTGPAFEGNGYGRVVLTATDATQYAWEGDRIIGEADNSLFTHYMVEGLRTGAADRDADGRITLDEMYDYVYERVVMQTPKQTPGKWSYKQQGDIIIARNPKPIVKPAELPIDLTTALESPLSNVRLGAVRELDRLLNGSNAGLALAAFEAIKSLAEDDSRSVSNAATSALQAYTDKQRARDEQERLARDRAEAERQAALKAEQHRLAAAKAEKERIAKERAEAERQAALKAEEERIAEERAEAERQAALKAEQDRLAAERAEAERQAALKVEADRQAALKAEEERIAKERAEAERQAALKVEADRQAALRAEEKRVAQERVAKERAKAETERLEREREEAWQSTLQSSQGGMVARVAQPTFVITLGLSVPWVIAFALGDEITVVSLLVAGAVSVGAISMSLRRLDLDAQWRHFLGLAGGWIAGGAIVFGVLFLLNGQPLDTSSIVPLGLIMGAMWGAVGGTVTGYIVRGLTTAVGEVNIAWIAAGWAGGWAAASVFLTSRLISNSPSRSSDFGLLLGLAGAIIGAVGGGVTFWQIDRARFAGTSAATTAQPLDLRTSTSTLPTEQTARRTIIIVGVGWLSVWLLGTVVQSPSGTLDTSLIGLVLGYIFASGATAIVLYQVVHVPKAGAWLLAIGWPGTLIGALALSAAARANDSAWLVIATALCGVLVARVVFAASTHVRGPQIVIGVIWAAAFFIGSGQAWNHIVWRANNYGWPLGVTMARESFNALTLALGAALGAILGGFVLWQFVLRARRNSAS